LNGIAVQRVNQRPRLSDSSQTKILQLATNTKHSNIKPSENTMSNADPFAASSMNSYASNSMGGYGSQYPQGYYQPVESFDYGRVFSAPFKSPNWVMNVLWCVGCVVLSSVVVGTLVLFGYVAEVAVARTGGRKENWPDFDINRLSDYLLRGLWPFLWNLIWTFILMIVGGIPMLITVALASALGNNDQVVPAILVGVVGGVISLVIYWACLVMMMASMMHSALGNDFMKGADTRWIGLFFSRMSGVCLVAALVIGLASVPLSLLGLLFCFVGIFVVQAYLYLVFADATAQIHDIFVSRGGPPAFEPMLGDDGIVEAQIV